MRFKEFAPIFEADAVAGDQFVLALNNYINTAALKDKEQGLPMKFNWKGFANLMKHYGYEMAADYETFKVIYDGSPEAVKAKIKDFNRDYIELEVPGITNDNPELAPGQDSQNAVNQMAAKAADKQLKQAAA